MRERIARKLLNRFERGTPGILRRMQIQILTDLAAGSFGLPGPRVWHRSAPKALEEYAAFTVRCMRKAPASPDHLFARAFALGERVGRISGLTRDEDLQRLVFLLYRNIDITMEGSLPGDIRVVSCYFSGCYDPDQCATMSCVDSGIVSGIFGGGRLTFRQRITEGNPCCRACFISREGGAGTRRAASVAEPAIAEGQQ